MSATTKNRIEKVIGQLNYRPSNIARSLKAHESGVVGCVVADIISPFPLILSRGLMMYVLLDTITSDNYNATYNCIKFLHKQGYKKIGFFTEPLGNISSRYV